MEDAESSGIQEHRVTHQRFILRQSPLLIQGKHHFGLDFIYRNTARFRDTDGNRVKVTQYNNTAGKSQKVKKLDFGPLYLPFNNTSQ